jgi:hypothetical protein
MTRTPSGIKINKVRPQVNFKESRHIGFGVFLVHSSMFSTKKLEVHTFSLTFAQIYFLGSQLLHINFSLIQRPKKCIRKLKINVLNVVYIVQCAFVNTMIGEDFINFYFVSCGS